jgi:hypothetical protein
MRLFLDDEREPPDDGQDWVVVRSVHEATTQALAAYLLGIPLEYVSFDNDLGENQPEGKDFAKWLVKMDENRYPGMLTDDFNFYIHSQNPVAYIAIKSYIEGYLQARKDFDDATN